MKRLLLVIALFLTSIASFAAHIIGGEMRYEYVGPGTAPNSKIFRIYLLLFKGDATGPNVAPLEPSYVVGIYNNDGNIKFPGTAVNSNWTISRVEPPGIIAVPIVFPPCIQNAPVLNYTYATYSMLVELPNSVNGYTIVFQTCCRINGIQNVGNSVGSTYMCSIPGTAQIGTDGDSSPKFSVPVNVICNNAPFFLNFSAEETDPNDSLVYRLCDAFNGGGATGGTFTDPAPPPYGFVSYNPPYTGANPFGTGATINPQTGVITGMAPGFGKYVVSVCVDVYRAGIRITTQRKDLIVQVSDCDIVDANPRPDYVTCDGFNVQFDPALTSGASTYFWNFGDPTTLADTSLLPNPSYTYTDTGIYTITFIINGGTSCVDTAIRRIGVYPGFFPGFVATGSCFTNPYSFQDTSNTQFGVVNSWSWNFGNLATLADTSHIQSPTYTYPSPGIRTVQLIVTNSKGCIDTALVDVNVLDKPLITMDFTDTLICIPDAVTLGAVGSGTFSWTPLVNIVNPNTANPTVNPTVDTWYIAHMNDNGCLNEDSVLVRVVPNVSINVMPDTTICLTDAVTINAVSDGLSFSWTNGSTLNDPNILNPVATPTQASTTYILTATIGSCSSTDQVIIATVPYPVADAGPPQTICYNTSAQLNASHDGTRFFWTPTTYLDNPNILNPVTTPPRTTMYILTVNDDVSGCPKPSFDTVIVTVRPRIHPFAGRDTTVIVSQPLQFNATGGTSYQWIPGSYLNNPNIHNPVGIYPADIDSIRYKLLVSDIAGCADSAFVTVYVWKTNPYVFVPTAFTPNGDGRNDVIRPIAVGIARINYFSIYNRWGQLLFTTTTNKHGWDGRVGGQLQATGVFVWMVSATDYLGKPIFLKGTVTLIR
jgi:gliding motility-associated-like protein